MAAALIIGVVARVIRAVQDDLDRLVELVREFYETDGHDFDASRVRAGLVPLLAEDTVGQVWLVTDSSPVELVGYAVVTWGWSLESGGKDALVDELFLRVRGAGLGEKLLRHAIAAAREAGARRMYLETEAPNERARAFYARLGFVPDNSVWMSRDLNEDNALNA